MIKRSVKSLLLIVALILSLALNTVYIGRYIYFKHVFKDRRNYGNVAYRNRLNMYDSLALSHSSIVFIGDSQTQGYNVAEFFDNASCVNRGIGGDRSASLLKRLSYIIKGSPAKIFLQVGVNDITQKVPVEVFSANIARVISEIQLGSPGTKLFIESIFPTSHINRSQLISFNRALQLICAKYAVTYIDLYPQFDDHGHLKKEYDSGDGLHLNYAGYKAWTAILKPYVTQ